MVEFLIAETSSEAKLDEISVDGAARKEREYLISYKFHEDITELLRALETAGFDGEMSDDPTKMKVWKRGDSNF